MTAEAAAALYSREAVLSGALECNQEHGGTLGDDTDEDEDDYRNNGDEKEDQGKEDEGK